MPSQDLKDLQRELAELGQRRHALKSDELFVVWFLLAAVSDAEDDAVRSLTGLSGEKGLDALLIDDSARAVFIVQGKYHTPIGKGHEPRSDVMAFADLPGYLCGADEAFDSFLCDLEPNARAKVQQARERLVDRDYRLQCYYATTKRCSAKLRKEAEDKVRRVRRPKQKPALDIYDASRVTLLLRTYLAGAAPPVPLLELPVQENTLKDHDPDTQIEAWVCSMRGDQVGELFNAAGERIFARNIRGYLGEGKVNDRIQETLERQPQRFWYFNNGITIVCDSAVEERGKGEHVLALTQPQIINGQQTTRTLAASGRKARKARVAVRVISIPRESPGGSETYDELVAQIVEATNWQNAITSADLRANHPRQIEIERELARLNYFYIRKRQAKAEVRARAPRHMPLVSKEDLMRAGASCLRPNLPLQMGIQKLFEDEHAAIFEKQSTRRLLSQHMLFRKCASSARGSSTRKYGKFIACHMLWEDVATVLRSNPRHEQFVALCAGQGDEQLTKKLDQTVDAAFKAVDAYFRAERGTGAQRAEPSTFFKRRDVFNGLETWLAAEGKNHAARLEKRADALTDALSQ